jgi:hypothetical protein
MRFVVRAETAVWLDSGDEHAFVTEVTEANQ